MGQKFLLYYGARFIFVLERLYTCRTLPQYLTPTPSREISCKVQVLLLHRWLTVFTHIFISHIYTRTHARMLIHPGKKAEVVEVGKHVVTRSSPREPRGEQLWFQGVSRQPLPFARRSHRRHTHTHTQKICFLSHRQTAEVRSIIMMV